MSTNKKSILRLIFIALLVGSISGCTWSKRISTNDLIVWMEDSNKMYPGMATLCLQYNRVAQITSSSHTITWEAPGGLGGFCSFIDPSDGTVYGRGNWPDEWDKANEDNVISVDEELPLVYYEIGKVKESDGKLSVDFPEGTSIIFKPPELFSPANYYIIIKLPNIPPQADKSLYNVKKDK